jgi:hypothetical protein
MKPLQQKAEKADYEQEVKESFKLFKIKEHELPTYTNAKQFSRSFKRCDRMEYSHTRYSVTSSAND